MDFINELNSSSYSDLSDPDLTDTELEFIEKENFAKQSAVALGHRGSFSRSQSLNMTKNNSLEQHDVPEELKFEYEQGKLLNEPHVVSNTKGWHWISSIQGKRSLDHCSYTICLTDLFQGEGETTRDGITNALNRLEGESRFKEIILHNFNSFLFCDFQKSYTNTQ